MGDLKSHDISGQKFNMLTAINPLFIKYTDNKGREKTRVFYKCLCDCGKFRDVNAHNLKIGKAYSCGCTRKSRTTPDRELVLTRAVYASNILERSKRKFGNTDALTFEDFYKMSKMPCFYCNRIGINYLKDKVPLSNYVLRYNGLDRVENEKPYSLENSVPACGQCNSLKWVDSVDVFFNRIKNVYLNLDLANYNRLNWTQYENQKINHYPMIDSLSDISVDHNMENVFLWRRAYFSNVIRENIRFYGCGTDISFSDYCDLAKSPCSYCGLSEMTTFLRSKNKKNIIWFNTLDRINSNLPYTKSNVLPACKMCNLGKQDYCITEYLENIKRVVEFHGLLN